MTVFGLGGYCRFEPRLEVGDGAWLEFHGGNCARRMRNKASENTASDPRSPESRVAILRQVDDVVVADCADAMRECVSLHLHFLTEGSVNRAS